MVIVNVSYFFPGLQEGALAEDLFAAAPAQPPAPAAAAAPTNTLVHHINITAPRIF